MKKLFFLLTTILAFSSCSMNDNDESFDDSEFFEEYFEEWGITIPYQNFSKSETYHLLENLIDDIYETKIYHITYPSSYMNIYHIDYSSSDLNFSNTKLFNEYVWNNEKAAVFFEREDCISVLISTYLTSIKTKRYLTVDDEWWGNKFFTTLELLLSSEMALSKMNVTEKVHSMVLALEMDKYRSRYSSSIIIYILLSSGYDNLIDNIIIQAIEVYQHATDKDPVTGFSQHTADYAHDLIIGYAKNFIKLITKHHEIN